MLFFFFFFSSRVLAKITLEESEDISKKRRNGKWGLEERLFRTFSLLGTIFCVSVSVSGAFPRWLLHSSG